MLEELRIPYNGSNDGSKFEEGVQKYFEGKGYYVVRNTPKRKTQIAKINGEKIKIKTGVPDFLIVKNGEIFFVECKIGNGWRYSQVKWLVEHIRKIKVVVVMPEKGYISEKRSQHLEEKRKALEKKIKDSNKDIQMAIKIFNGMSEEKKDKIREWWKSQEKLQEWAKGA